MSPTTTHRLHKSPFSFLSPRLRPIRRAETGKSREFCEEKFIPLTRGCQSKSIRSRPGPRLWAELPAVPGKIRRYLLSLCIRLRFRHFNVASELTKGKN